MTAEDIIPIINSLSKEECERLIRILNDRERKIVNKNNRKNNDFEIRKKLLKTTFKAPSRN